MVQIKKKFLSLFLLLLILLCPQNVLAEETKRNQSDVAEQKSVIDEQKPWRDLEIGITLNRPQIISKDILEKAKEVEIKKEIENKNPYRKTINSLSDVDKNLICRITFREAGNQCIEGQRAVMEVILNRVQSDIFPDDVPTVLSSSGQFSTWKSRNNVGDSDLTKMQTVLDLVYLDSDTILPTEEYVYFNCKDPGKDSVKIQEHWFWI